MNLAIIGLGVMGRNLALNFRDVGREVVVWDPWPQAREWKADGINVFNDLEELLAELPKPRVVLILVKAGDPVLQIVMALRDLLSPGDIIIDGGNAHYVDTEKNALLLADYGINYAGLGISGGAEGARNGPSMMLGCSSEVREVLEPLLSGVAAMHNEQPCLGWFGDGGAGHFVKMVHNGIEYAIMEAISESWLLLEDSGMSAAEAGRQLGTWAKGDLSGYLMEISAEVLQTSDTKSGQPLVSVVDHAAGQKGTGRWCVVAALEFGVPVPSIMAAVTMRQISSYPSVDVNADPVQTQQSELASGDIFSSLAANMALALAQGAHLLEVANHEHGWKIDLGEAARVWRAGSILRMKLLDTFFNRPALFEYANDHSNGLRNAVSRAAMAGIPVPALSSGLSYLDAFNSDLLPTALVQLQRDRFGAHGLKKKVTGEQFHGPWHGTQE
jgi:6-phosphogluconate dehydrogenase